MVRGTPRSIVLCVGVGRTQTYWDTCAFGTEPLFGKTPEVSEDETVEEDVEGEEPKENGLPRQETLSLVPVP